MKEYIGVDLGGAYFKAGRVFEGSVRSEASNAVHRNSTESELFNSLF